MRTTLKPGTEFEPDSIVCEFTTGVSAEVFVPDAHEGLTVDVVTAGDLGRVRIKVNGIPVFFGYPPGT
jgi:hypothetical protein